MKLAYTAASWSKDRSTQVGAIIVRNDNEIIDVAYNGFPRGINDYWDCRHDRPMKYIFTEHAERNAINNCARKGISTEGCTMFTTLMPCHECARSIIQAGITTVYYAEKASERFKVSSDHAKKMFDEAKIKLIFLA